MKKDKVKKENTPVFCESVTRALVFPEKENCMAELFERRGEFCGVNDKINKHYEALSAALCEYASGTLVNIYRDELEKCESVRERCAVRPYRVVFSVFPTSLPEENCRGVVSACVQYTLFRGAKTVKSIVLRDNWNAKRGFIYTRSAFLRLFGEKGEGAPYLEGAELGFDVSVGRKI